MLLCKVENLQYRYEEEIENILEEISFTINSESKIGLIGKNGSGKSTLLNILRGKLETNNIEYTYNNLNIGYLPQEISKNNSIKILDFIWEISPKLNNLRQKINLIAEKNLISDYSVFSEFEDLGGYEFEVNIEKMLFEFGFDLNILKRKLISLSGGEKNRIALGRILLTKPDLLILDEPTNHLDINALEWLENYLKNQKIPFIIISHDRRFLDNCVNEIFEISDKNLRKYSGNYSFYEYEKEIEYNRKLLEYEVQKKKLNQLRKAARDRKTWALSHQAETGPEGFAPIYEIVTNPAEKAMKRAKAVEKRINMIIEKEEAKKPFLEKKRLIIFDMNYEIKNKVVLKIENLYKCFNKNEIIKDFNLLIKNKERVCISGLNGSGKSTLLKIITKRLNYDNGNIYFPPKITLGYYSQEVDELNTENTVIEEVIGGNKLIETEARILLGCLHIRENLINKKINSLSSGEKSKVALTKIILEKPSLLILDEPTNHLEISSRIALENALEKFEGTIIFASHDRYFQERIATRLVNL